MAATALVAASLAALAAGGLGVDADVSAAVGARHVELDVAPAAPGGTAPTSARSTGQLELVPRVVVRGEAGPRFVAEYAPRLFLPVDLAGGAPELTDRGSFDERAEVLHRGGLGVEDAFRSLALAFRGDVTYGKTDLLQGADWTPDLVPTTGRIRILNVRSTVSLSSAPTRRLTLSAEAGAFRNGGADAEARATLPLQQGVLVGADLGWKASRRDLVSAGIAGTMASTAGTGAAFLRASAGWRRQASRTVTLRGGAGLVTTRTSPPDGETARGLSPWAEVGLEHASEGGRLTQGVGVRVEPGIDQITGEVSQRLEARGSLSWRVAREWTLGAEARASAARLSPGGLDLGTSNVTSRVASMAFRAERRFDGGARLAVGAWSRWQDSRITGIPSFLEWGGLLEASLDLLGD